VHKKSPEQTKAESMNFLWMALSWRWMALWPNNKKMPARALRLALMVGKIGGCMFKRLLRLGSQ
jgi:hypothetical protein